MPNKRVHVHFSECNKRRGKFWLTIFYIFIKGENVFMDQIWLQRRAKFLFLEEYTDFEEQRYYVTWRPNPGQEGKWPQKLSFVHKHGFQEFWIYSRLLSSNKTICHPSRTFQWFQTENKQNVWLSLNKDDWRGQLEPWVNILIDVGFWSVPQKKANIRLKHRQEGCTLSVSTTKNF